MNNHTPAEKLAKKLAQKLRPSACSREKAWETTIKTVRQSLGLTMAQVADALDMSYSGYWQIEFGCDTSLSSAARVAEFFGKGIPDLWIRRVTAA